MKSQKATCILQTLSGQECLCEHIASFLDGLVDVANLEYMSEGHEGTPIYDKLLDSSRLMLQAALLQMGDVLSNIHGEISEYVSIVEDPKNEKPAPLAFDLHEWEGKTLRGNGWER